MPLKQSPALNIELGAQLQIVKARLPSSAKKFLREKLFIFNSEYFVKQQLGKPVYDVPKFFDLIEKDPPYLRLPRGFLDQLTSFLDKENISYTVTHRHPEFASYRYDNTIKLRNQQKRIITQAFDAGEGVIVAPPGSGKTIMGLELVAQHQKPALILTHRKELLNQWVEHIEKYFGIPKKQIGTYCAERKKIGTQITVGLLQSFARSKDPADFTDKFGVIIIDECHHIPAKTFRAVITHLNAAHIYGLTATPKRKHNDEQLIYLYIGDIVATMQSDSDKKESGFDISIRETSLQLPFDWKIDQYELLAKVICYDTARNKLIVKDILDQLKMNRKVLVLSERKEHLSILNLYLRDQAETIVFSGDDTTKNRAIKLQQINDGEYKILLATGQIFGEGMHVPNVEVLILAFPFAFEGKLVQYVGRLLHGASPRKLIDYRDTHVEILEKQFTKRQRYYKKIQKTA